MKNMISFCVVLRFVLLFLFFFSYSPCIWAAAVAKNIKQIRVDAIESREGAEQSKEKIESTLNDDIATLRVTSNAYHAHTAASHKIADCRLPPRHRKRVIQLFSYLFIPFTHLHNTDMAWKMALRILFFDVIDQFLGWYDGYFYSIFFFLLFLVLLSCVFIEIMDISVRQNLDAVELY